MYYVLRLAACDDDVRFGSKALGHVRFTTESGHVQRKRPCSLGARSGHLTLFDHLVRTGDERQRHTQPSAFKLEVAPEPNILPPAESKRQDWAPAERVCR